MKFENILKFAKRDRTVMHTVPLNPLPLYPRFTERNGKVVAEIFYTSSGKATERYTVYPVSVRILFDLEDKTAVLVERIKKPGVDYTTPLGSYEALLRENGITIESLKSYAKRYEELEDNGNLTVEALPELRKLWEDITPKEIRATI